MPHSQPVIYDRLTSVLMRLHNQLGSLLKRLTMRARNEMINNRRKTKKTLIASLLSTVLLGLPSAANAHHSRFAIDTNELVEIQGTIESVFWRNPHVIVAIRVVDDSGAETVWELEGGPVNVLERSGVRRDDLIIGPATVLGLASVREDNYLQPVRIYYGDGRQVTLSGQHARRFGLAENTPQRAVLDPELVQSAIRDANGLFRVWTNRGRTDGQRQLPLRPAAQAAKDNWDQATDDHTLRCEPPGMPEAMVSPFPIELLDQGDTIAARLEAWDNVRTIYMNPETSPQDPAPSRLGHSVGRWEGDDLVVTTNRIRYPYLDDEGTPQSEAVEVVERFIISEDKTRLDWHASVVDGAIFTSPVQMPIMHFDWVAGEQIKPYDCALAE